MKTFRGQAVLIDFAFAFTLFILMWGFIAVQFGEKEAEHDSEAGLLAMRVKADFVLENLVKNTGSPDNWETLAIGDVNSIGIASSDRVVSEAKLVAFSNFSADYNTLKRILGLGEYDFYFEFTGADSVDAGVEPVSDADEVILNRIVEYKGESANAVLKVYRLE